MDTQAHAQKDNSNADDMHNRNPSIHHSSWGSTSKHDGSGDEDALRRIHIKYIKSVAELVKFLATIQECNQNEPQCNDSDKDCEGDSDFTTDIGAIVVDDLDCYIRHGSSNVPFLVNAGDDGTPSQKDGKERQHRQAHRLEIKKLIQLCK